LGKVASHAIAIYDLIVIFFGSKIPRNHSDSEIKAVRSRLTTIKSRRDGRACKYL
jgi:hypothetical protein